MLYYSKDWDLFLGHEMNFLWEYVTNNTVLGMSNEEKKKNWNKVFSQNEKL